MIVKQGVASALMGIAVGFLAALALPHFAASLLYGVSPTDPLIFVLVPASLVVVALVACLLPVRAAARLNPVDVLRSE
jgi:putative ABC transport system permease protein